MKKIIILFFCCFYFFTFSQKNLTTNLELEEEKQYSFYLKITSGKTPIILSKSAKKVQLFDANSEIQSIYNKYEIYDFIKAFPNAKTESLKDIYFVKVNKRELINELRSNFANIYTYSEEKGEIKYLLNPNDYGLAWNGEQKNLDLINAKQAWDITTGDPNIFVGISDLPIRTNHEDLLGKVVGYTNNTTYSSHGTEVAGVVAANTNNGVGLSSIGNNIRLLYSNGDWYFNSGFTNLWNLYQSGAKIINGSWHYGNCAGPSQIDQDAINEMYNNGVVLVFAAGNTTTCGSSKDNPIYPASYDNVISVTSVGTQDVGFNWNGNQVEWRDRVENIIGDSNKTHHLNDLVDIGAPGYAIPVLTNNSQGQKYRAVWGTSTAAPHISGTAGLMFSVNSNLSSKEVETILKLTSSNLDSIPENSNYIDKMGSGRLDAHKAVKMAYEMAQPNSFIEVKNRDFYRDWSFEIKNAPFGIKISNEKFRNSIKVDFTAKDYIEITNTVLEPNTSGYTVLNINPTTSFKSNKNQITKTSFSKTNEYSFFNGNTYQLKHFIKNDEIVEFNLLNPNDSNDNAHRGIPQIQFAYDKISNTLDASINGYCNETDAKYKIKNNYLEVSHRGGTTLNDCGSDEEIDYFLSITGNYYLEQPSQKVNYVFSEDYKELIFWVDDKHKLVFEQKVLNLQHNQLEESIMIYPNPTDNFINISSKNKSIEISEIIIFDYQGREILKMESDFNKINLSGLSAGIYFFKINSKKGLSFTEKIIVSKN